MYKSTYIFLKPECSEFRFYILFQGSLPGQERGRWYIQSTKWKNCRCSAFVTLKGLLKFLSSIIIFKDAGFNTTVFQYYIFLNLFHKRYFSKHMHSYMGQQFGNLFFFKTLGLLMKCENFHLCTLRKTCLSYMLPQ